jgi:SAM-dependent methyltransferase
MLPMRVKRTLDRVCRVCARATSHSFQYEKAGFEIWRCDACGVGWTEVGDNFEAADIYSADYFEGGRSDGYADYGKTENVLRREFRAVLKQLGRVRPLAGKLVEIGSAYGYFLLEAQKYFEARGIEVSAAAVEYARSRGVQCVQGEVSDALLDQCGPVDVAVMLDVIEHLTSPQEALSKLHAHMRPGGHLVITTGDWGSVHSRLAGKKWRLMTPPQHLFFFTSKSMCEMLRAAGFKVVSLSRPTKLVPVSLILFQLGRLIRNKPFTVRGWSDAGIPVNLFDSMRVIATREDTGRGGTG